MDNKRIGNEIEKIVENYINVLKEKYNISEVYVFGSYAKGNEREDSDIDIAIVSNDFIDRMDAMLDLLMLKTDIDLRIEPHPFNQEEFEDGNPFVQEIKNTGLKVA